MDELSEVLQVYNQKNRLIAKIVLNGYNIPEGGPIGRHGIMHSFKIVRGDLWDQWAAQQAFVVRGTAGIERRARVAALPVEEEGFGLIEFL